MFSGKLHPETTAQLIDRVKQLGLTLSEEEAALFVMHTAKDTLSKTYKTDPDTHPQFLQERYKIVSRSRFLSDLKTNPHLNLAQLAPELDAISLWVTQEITKRMRLKQGQFVEVVTKVVTSTTTLDEIPRHIAIAKDINQCWTESSIRDRKAVRIHHDGRIEQLNLPKKVRTKGPCKGPGCDKSADRYHCGRCGVYGAHYCSRECQKRHWPTHKKVCGKQRVNQ